MVLTKCDYKADRPARARSAFILPGVVTMDEKGMLTPKEERFCLEYVIDYNGAAAAPRAGYAGKSAAKQASRLLARPEVMERVRQLQKEQRERLCISSDLVVTKTMELLDICMAAKPVLEWDYSEHKMVNSGEYQVDSKGAGKCLEILGKHLGMFDKDPQSHVDDRPVFYAGEADIKD